MTRKLLILPALLLIAALALAACGGDDGPDPDTIAAGALLTAADLPGDGWEVEESSGPDDDDNDNDSDDFLASESCRELRELGEAFGSDDDDDDDTLATREREFERQDGAELLRVGAEVEVKGGDLDLSAGQAAALRLLPQSTVLEQCFADAMESSLASADEDTPPLELTSVELVEIDPVLPDSFAFGVVIVVSIAGLDFDFSL